MEGRLYAHGAIPSVVVDAGRWLLRALAFLFCRCYVVMDQRIRDAKRFGDLFERVPLFT